MAIQSTLCRRSGFLPAHSGFLPAHRSRSREFPMPRPRPVHRRAVLQASAAVLAGGGLADSALSAAPSKSPSEKLNLACIGIGGRGRANVRGVQSQNLVAFCDVDTKRAAETIKAFPGVPLFSDYRRMFDKLDGKIDGVVVSTPDHTHFHPSMMAMQRGLHLYCEKPMGHSVQQTRQMTEAARKSGVATQLGMQRHNNPAVRRAVELVRSGSIGEVSEVYTWIASTRGMPSYPAETSPVPNHLDWDLWLGPTSPRPFSSDICPYKWRFWWDYGTGETGNWGCHILDIAFWALDLKYPTRVDVVGTPDPHPEVTPTEMQTRFRFPPRDGQPELTLYWGQQKLGPDILREHPVLAKLNASENARKWNTLFIGSEGMLLCGFNDYVLLPREKFAEFKEPESFIPPPANFYQQWISAAKGGDAAGCEFDYSGPLTETVLLANVTFRTKGGFDWDGPSRRASGNPDAEKLLTSHYRDGWQI